VEFQRKQRSKSTLHSELLEVPGIGAKTVRLLMRRFGSVRRIRHAAPEELREAIGEARTRKLMDYFQTEPASQALEADARERHADPESA